MEILRLIAGFSGALDIGALGWSTVCGIETPKGLIMVDTGGPACRRTLGEAVQKAGYCARDVQTLVLTHLHWDHIYNADLFPNATLWVSRREYEAAFSDAGALAYHPALLSMIAARKPVLTEAEEYELAPGVALMPTPGHTPGSIAVLVRRGRDTAAIAGDAIKTRAELGGRVGMTRDARDSARSIRAICERADVIYPGHDHVFRVRDGAAEPALANDYWLTASAGTFINGQKQLRLHMDYEEGE